jgi:hypothetical protein
MVNPFHLHNCGNSVDICGLAFLPIRFRMRSHTSNPYTFNGLERVRLGSLWQFVCSIAY